MRAIYLLALALAACSPAPSASGTSPVKGEEGFAPTAQAASPISGEVAVRPEGATPTPTRTPIWKDQVFIDYQAQLAAASDDPRQVARLFIAALAHYDEDRAFALDLMSAAAADALVHDDPNCRSGKLFNQELDPLWIQMDAHPAQASAFFDSPANALAPDADAHVQLDAAASRQDAATASVVLKPARTIHLTKQAKGWRVAEFSEVVSAL